MSLALSNTKTDEKVGNAAQKVCQFFPDASVEKILYVPELNPNRGSVERLSSYNWIRNGEHCIIPSATGCSKTWLASALLNTGVGREIQTC